MKRVTERSDLGGKAVPDNISGCRFFEGEDLSNYSDLMLFYISIFLDYRQRMETN